MPVISVRVTPNASQSEIVSREHGQWRVRLAASPIEGKANKALIQLIADEYGCAQNCVRIVRGLNSKIKTIDISV
jgi:uncharacterized protein